MRFPLRDTDLILTVFFRNRFHNSNLQDLASADDLRMGYPVLREASLRSGIPVVYTSARKEFLDSFLQTPNLEDRFVGTPLPLETFMHRSWTNFADGGI